MKLIKSISRQCTLVQLLLNAKDISLVLLGLNKPALCDDTYDDVTIWFTIVFHNHLPAMYMYDIIH